MTALVALSLFAVPILAYPFESYANDTSVLNERGVNLEWTAWGDSYASGVGAGTYQWQSWRCLRYDQSYTYQTNADAHAILSGKPGTLNMPACSGATTGDVLERQFYEKPSDVPSSPQYWWLPAGHPKFGTLTIGGDDIDFIGLIVNCLTGDVPGVVGNPSGARTCDEQRALSWGLIADGGNHDKPNPGLVDKIEAVIKKILDYGKKYNGNDFRLYVTGYGQFFDTRTNDCDTASFVIKTDRNPPLRPTLSLRQDLNAMSVTLNTAIQAAADRHKGEKVTYLDIDYDLTTTQHRVLNARGHRFCEPGVKEPDQNNPDLYIQHYPYASAKAVSASFPNAAKYLDTFNQGAAKSIAFDKKSTTLSAYIKQWWATVDMNQLNAALKLDTAAGGVNEPPDVRFWRDVVGESVKMFHPNPRWHEMISENILTSYKFDTTPQPPPKGPAYKTGICSFHVNEYWKCGKDDSNLSADIHVVDNDKNTIIDVKDQGINDKSPLHVRGPLPADLVITGEHQNDYIQFNYQTNPSLSWTSGTTHDQNKDAWCNLGGWDPRGGPWCYPYEGKATRQMDCFFKC